MEAATRLLPSRRAKRARIIPCSLPSSSAQIQSPSRGGAKRRRHQPQPGAKRLRACSSSSSSTPPPPPPPSWGAKRARIPLSRHGSLLPCHNKWRDWANLAEGPAGLIADCVLANDVADYVRFRAVCRSWRCCASEPLAHGSLDRRFHPRRWKMLRGRLAGASNRLRFLNTSTGECIRVHLPELRDHDLLAVTPEGLLLLLHDYTHVSLLNPLTRHHLTQLPPLTTLLPPEQHDKLSDRGFNFRNDFAAWGSGFADDDSTVVLCFDWLRMLGVAKPGDERWTPLKFTNRLMTAPLMLAGRFYCVTQDGLMVLVYDSGSDQPPRLEVAAELPMGVSAMCDSVHLVDNGGELILVHRRFQRPGINFRRAYDTYRVDLDTGTVFPVKSLGGRALSIGMHCSLSVLPQVFPSGSIASDTIYLSFDVEERTETEAYHLADRSTEPAKYNLDGSVLQPCTALDALSLCCTVRYQDFLSSVF